MSVCVHEAEDGRCLKGASPYGTCVTPCCHYINYPYGTYRKVKLYYYDNGDKVTVKNFGDGVNVTEALHKAIDWCKENCEKMGVFEYYYNGHRILCEHF